jgi:hypothetical protein
VSCGGGSPASTSLRVAAAHLSRLRAAIPHSPVRRPHLDQAVADRSKIFISYRREDSSGHVGRLHDALATQLGRDSIFMDIDSIAPGADFVDVLQQSLERAAVVIVVMGTRWAGPKPDGTRRIDDERDFVRLEVAKALADTSVRVIPVLINRAEMLPESSLPEPLKELARRNAIEISDIRWAHDTKLLAAEIARTPAEIDGLLSPSWFARLPRSIKILGAAVAAILVLFIWKPWQHGTVDAPNFRDGASPAELARIPKPAEMKLPSSLLGDARDLLKRVQKEWKADALIDEIATDCRSGQCSTNMYFLSPEQMLGLTASRANPDDAWRFVNANGTVNWGLNGVALNVLELDKVIDKAREYGMVGPLQSALLTFRKAQGQSMLVWLITPKVYRTGGQNAFCFDAKSMLQYDCNQLRT